MKKYRIGVDIGGTYITIALVDLDGKIVYSNTTPTRADLGYEHTLGNIKLAISDLMKETNETKDTIEAIGFGFPGQIDYQAGVVRLLPNMPGWVDIPVAEIMQKEFGIPTRLDNDVRVATLGELKYGAGKGCTNLVCITVGTGIGSGLVINGKLARGAKNAAGEIGHIKLSMNDGPLCGCGDFGRTAAVGPWTGDLRPRCGGPGGGQRPYDHQGGGSDHPLPVHPVDRKADLQDHTGKRTDSGRGHGTGIYRREECVLPGDGCV